MATKMQDAQSKAGVKTAISPSILSQAAQGVRGIAGVMGAWFSPQEPLNPVAPSDVVGRLWDYQAGYNLNTTPRPYEGGIYQALRDLSKVDLIRLLIETRKDQLEALPWEIKAKEGKKGDHDKKIAEITTFLQQPDRYHSWHQWLRMLIEDLLVIDAPTVYKRRTRGGGLYALEVVDGSTIAVKIDQFGRVPIGPGEVAFQQLLNGVPACDYSVQDMIFAPRNVRSHTVYGYSPVEQIAYTINIVARRLAGQLDIYDSGNIPPGLIELPIAMTDKQIEAFMKTLNARLSGNVAEQQKMYPVPGGTKYQKIDKPSVVEQAAEEWFARVCCFAFSIAPQPFVKEMNRATAQTSKDTAMQEGLAPLMLWVKRLMDGIIALEFGEIDLEFGWQDDKEQDPTVQANTLKIYTSSGIIAIDEARVKLGEAPLGGAYAVPMALTSTGYVAIRSPEEQQAASDQAAQQQADALKAKQQQPGAESDNEPNGKPPKPGGAKPGESKTQAGENIAEKPVNKAADYGSLRKAGGLKPAPLAHDHTHKHP